MTKQGLKKQLYIRKKPDENFTLKVIKISDQ